MKSYEIDYSARRIARDLNVSRHSVKSIIDQEGETPEYKPRKDRIEIDEELLRKLYVRCNGWAERIHEILIEEEGIKIGYSTLTSKIRELGLGCSKKK